MTDKKITRKVFRNYHVYQPNAKVNVLIDAEVGTDDGSMYPGPTAPYGLKAS